MLLKVRYRNKYQKHSTEVKPETISLTLPKVSQHLPITAKFQTRDLSLGEKPMRCLGGNMCSSHIPRVTSLGNSWMEDSCSYVALLHCYSFCIPMSVNTKDTLTLETSPQCEIASGSSAAWPCKHGAWCRLCPVLQNSNMLAAHGKTEL